MRPSSCSNCATGSRMSAVPRCGTGAAGSVRATWICSRRSTFARRRPWCGPSRAWSGPACCSPPAAITPSPAIARSGTRSISPPSANSPARERRWTPSVPTPPSTVPEAQTDDLSRSKRDDCPDPEERTVTIQTVELSRTSRTNGPVPAVDSDHLEADDLIRSLKGFQTDPQTDPETQQQQPQQAGTTGTVVVTSFETALVERGVTRRVASQLLHAIPPAILAHQLAIYDWLREADPEDPRLTPGRLRKMIEEDWAPPPGYTAPAERATRAVAERQASLARTSEDTRRRDELAAAAATRQELLDRVGLSPADQALWTRVVQTAPVLPTLFREALFHAPGNTGRGGGGNIPRPPDPGAGRWRRAHGDPLQGRRAGRRAVHRPQVRLLYLDLPTLCAQLAVPHTPGRPMGRPPRAGTRRRRVPGGRCAIGRGRVGVGGAHRYINFGSSP